MFTCGWFLCAFLLLFIFKVVLIFCRMVKINLLVINIYTLYLCAAAKPINAEELLLYLDLIYRF